MNEPMAMFDSPNTISEPRSQSRERTSCHPCASSDANDSRTSVATARSIRSSARVIIEKT